MIPLEKLVKEARRAAELSYSPYSKFRVGACVEVDGDLWYSGTNIENASYGLTICAERVAICKAASHGHRLLKRVIVYAPSQEVKTAPCGACRQFIKEFADDDTRIIEVCDSDSSMTFTMEELLPKAFGPNNLLKKLEAPKTEAARILDAQAARDELRDCRLCGQFPCADHAAYYEQCQNFLNEYREKNCRSCRGKGHYDDDFGMNVYCGCSAGKHLQEAERR